MTERLTDWYRKGYGQKLFTWFIFMLVAIIISILLEFICRGFLADKVAAALHEAEPAKQVVAIQHYLATFN